jgi:2-pyrone-4,6-dicarboxylate lactonase
VRGVRFQLRQAPGGLHPQDELLEIASRIAKLGWHVVIYFEAVDLPELWDFFTNLPTTVVVDHMGRPDVSKPMDGPEFQLFLKFMREQQRLEQGQLPRAPERERPQGPGRRAERLHRRDPLRPQTGGKFPDRVLWGTDWPHPNLKDHMPDDGLLVDFIPISRRRPSCSKSCWSPTPCACTGRKRSEMALDKPYQVCPAR